MSINWVELRKEMSPIKDYDDLSRRWREAFAYPFVTEAYNFTMAGLAEHTRRMLGEDTRKRYEEYCQWVVGTFDRLHAARVRDILDLVTQVNTCEQFEGFASGTGINGRDIIGALKYLVYWFIPMNKRLSGLADPGSKIQPAIQILREKGIRTNLDILQNGLTPEKRTALARSSGLPAAEIKELVNRADLSRMPWASKATISNIIGAGYENVSRLASADPEQVYQDYFRYGASIKKNLKLGNEIDNSCRIAKLMPVVLT